MALAELQQVCGRGRVDASKQHRLRRQAAAVAPNRSSTTAGAGPCLRSQSLQLPPRSSPAVSAYGHQLQQEHSSTSAATHAAAHLALEQDAVRLGLVPVDIHHACERGVALHQARGDTSVGSGPGT